MILDQNVFGNVTVGDLLIFVLVILITVLVGHLAYALIRRALQANLSKSSAKGFARLVEYCILVIGFYVAFWEILELDFTGLLVSLGIVGIALAFASQQIVQNAFAGIMFNFTRPLQLEDWVEVGGMPVTGLCRVKEITLMHTVLRDLDGRILYIPNSFILNNKLINYSQAGFVAVNVPLRLISVERFERLKQIVLEEADADPYILPHVMEEEKRAIARMLEKASFKAIYGGNRPDMSQFDPLVNITDIQGSKTLLNVRVWIRDPQNRDRIISDFLQKLRQRLVEEDIALADS